MRDADLKTRLLCCGIRLPEKMRTGRKGGAGPAGGRYLIVRNMVVNAPVYGTALKSPFSVQEENGRLVLVLENASEEPVALVEDPRFYDMSTREGIPYRKIALLHGRDCLATTVFQKCIHWRREPCSFCGIELSLGSTLLRKTPEQLAEVTKAAQIDGVTHVTLTTGTPNTKDRGAFMLAQCASAVREKGLPVHVQLEPVEQTYLCLLRDSGADTIGIHIETADEDTFRRVCPGKGFSGFKKAWEESVEIFGENQVSSYMLIGLGEDRIKTLSGIESMVQTGVIPYVVPFRPLLDTVMEGCTPPPFEVVKEYSMWAAQRMEEYGVDPSKNRAGCVRCGACSSVSEYKKML